MRGLSTEQSNTPVTGTRSIDSYPSFVVLFEAQAIGKIDGKLVTDYGS